LRTVTTHLTTENGALFRRFCSRHHVFGYDLMNFDEFLLLETSIGGGRSTLPLGRCLCVMDSEAQKLYFTLYIRIRI